MHAQMLKAGWLKFITGWTIVFLLRLLPFRPPNVEPIMATMMPFGRKFGYVGGFLFGFFSIILFDAYQGQLGQWTLITGLTYGVIGLFAFRFFRNKPNKSRYYVGYSIVGTLVYDAITGLTIGPLFFGQPFAEAFFGQIPFTAMHLGSNVVLAAILSPLIYRSVVDNKELEARTALQSFTSLVSGKARRRLHNE